MFFTNRQIIFTEKNKAELKEVEKREPGPYEVSVKTAVSTISAGTERANITGDENVSISGAHVAFPRASGYSSSGIVERVGSEVKALKEGDRVALYWSSHREFNISSEGGAVRLPDSVSFETGALSFISTFSLAAIRKTHLEIGESALVMGLGVLGQLAVKLLKAAGAVPIIAADVNAERRALALKIGADYAFDPNEEGFAEKIKKVTDGGVNTAIEVTGVGAGFNEALDCMARFGRVALLGCTRNSDFRVDYYRKIHGPGITVIGAHTLARPENESYPGYFTHREDMKAVLRLCEAGRLTLSDIVAETHSPKECGEVYNRLVFDKNFPAGVQFDWRLLK